MVRTAFIIAAFATVTACGKSERNDAGLSSGPNAFSVLPSQKLIQPSDYAALPKPTPGGANRTDVSPINDAIVALGGRVQNPGNDTALLAAIGATDASADDTERRGLFSINNALDAYAEAERLRALGYTVPSAPPKQ
ncbi:MAG: DUF3035 domain-containing protein [Planktomarina sp.]